MVRNGEVIAGRAPRRMIGRRMLSGGIALAVLVISSAMAYPASNDDAYRGDLQTIKTVRPVFVEGPVTATRIPEPFGLPSNETTNSPLSEKWRAVAAAIKEETETLARCRANVGDCPSPARQFLAIIETARSKTGRARLGEVNRAINLAIRPTSDLDQHAVPDRWMAPLATFAAGRGDCEDYAIAKYVALRESGVPAAELRLVVVRDMRLSEDHALLAVRFDARWLTLDNRRLMLIEDRDLDRVVPLFAVGGSDVDRLMSAAAGPSETAYDEVAPAGISVARAGQTAHD